MRAIGIIAAVGLAAAPAVGQGGQFTPPGALRQPVIESEDSMLVAMEEARWNLGKIRIDPVLFLRNVEAYDNLFSFADEGQAVSDVRAGAGAGLVAFLPIGPDVVATAAAVPEYVWWQKQTQLRNLVGRYSLGFYGYFNRLTVSLTGSRLEQESPLNQEIQTPVQTTTEQAALLAELDLGPFFGLFGSAGASRVEQPTDLPEELRTLRLASLNRDTETLSVGGRYERGDLRLAVGVELSEVTFDDDPDLRSNRAVSPTLELGYTRGTVEFGARVWSRAVEFEAGSPLEDTTELTGEANATWSLGERLGLTGYTGRSLVYSALDDANYYLDERFGASLGFEPHERIELALFAESGELRFALPEGNGVTRLDEYTNFGAGLSFRITDRARFELSFAEQEFDSNVPGQDRTVRTGGGTFRIGGDILSW